MRTGIDKTFERAVFLAMHKDRLATDFCPEIVAMFRHLAFMTQKDPAFLEDLVDLLLKNTFIRVDRPVDPEHAVIHTVIDKRRDILRDNTAVHCGLLTTQIPDPANGGKSCNRVSRDPSSNCWSPD